MSARPSRKPPCPAAEPTPPVRPECNGNKPNLFQLHQRVSLRNVYIGGALSLLVGALFYYTVSRPRRNAYKKFYANYDADASFKRMVEAGVLSAVEAIEEDEPQKKK